VRKALRPWDPDDKARFQLEIVFCLNKCPRPRVVERPKETRRTTALLPAHHRANIVCKHCMLVKAPGPHGFTQCLSFFACHSVPVLPPGWSVGPMSKSQSLAPSPFTEQRGGHSFCMYTMPITSFPPRAAPSYATYEVEGCLLPLKIARRSSTHDSARGHACFCSCCFRRCTSASMSGCTLNEA
jgi:hypothetical protein